MNRIIVAIALGVSFAGAGMEVGMGLNSARAESPVFSNAELADIAVAANRANIAATEFAVKHSTDPRIQGFAEEVLKHHQLATTQTEEAERKLHIKPHPSDLSRKIKRESDESLAAWKKLNGHEFDKAFLDYEIVLDQDLLDAIDRANTDQSPDARELLNKARISIGSHLIHAKRLQEDGSTLTG